MKSVATASSVLRSHRRHLVSDRAPPRSGRRISSRRRKECWKPSGQDLPITASGSRIAVSMKRIALGYALSVAIGMVLGLGMASSKFLEQTLGGLLVSLQSLPSICWLPMAVLWFGLSEKAILFVVVMGSVLSVTIAMESGRKQMPKIYAMAGRNLGAQRSQAVSLRAFSRQPALLAVRPQAGLGLRLALVDCGRNDLRQPRVWVNS